MSGTSTNLQPDIERGRGGDKHDVIGPTARPAHEIDKAQDEITHGNISSEPTNGDYGVLIYLAVVTAIAVALALAVWLA